MNYQGATLIDPDAGVTVAAGAELDSIEAANALMAVFNRIRDGAHMDALGSFLASICAGQDDPGAALQTLFVCTAAALRMVLSLPPGGRV